MGIVFEVQDFSKRRIRMTSERLSHIVAEHPEIVPYSEELIRVLKEPERVNAKSKTVYYYSRFYKQREQSQQLLVIVKYLNNHGFVITAYFVRSLP
ncbi:MAG: hypothetical protein ABIA93_03075 [Candidatus Woesearchaeota archaeon]